MFISDIMLKKLCRRLRILGFDTAYPISHEDDEIMELAKKEKRTLLTMDNELFRRAVKRGIKAFLVPKGEPEEQLAEVIKNFKLSIKDFPSRTLCPACNGKLEEVGRKDVQGLVPDAITQRHHAFWKCKACSKVFWEGSHWERISKGVEKVRALLQA